MLAFVKEFLANASADYGISLRPTRLNLSEAAARTVEQYREAAQRKELALEFAVMEGVTAVLADPSALDQVLDNLLSNALKFSPPGGYVRVTVSPLVTTVECSNQDQGPGFTSEDISHMFRRYGRLSARPTAGEPSTGLGLSIVQKLVGAMKGELFFKNKTGAGAQFTVRLPRAEV